MFDFPPEFIPSNRALAADDSGAQQIIEWARAIAEQGRGEELAWLDPAGRGAAARRFDWVADLAARASLMGTAPKANGSDAWPSYGAHTRRCLKVAAGIRALASPEPALHGCGLRASLPDLDYKIPGLALDGLWVQEASKRPYLDLLCQSLCRGLYDGLCDEDDFISLMEASLPGESVGAQRAARGVAELIEATGHAREPSHTRALSLTGLGRAFAAWRRAAPGLDARDVLLALENLELSPWKGRGMPAHIRGAAMSVIDFLSVGEALPEEEALRRGPGRRI